MGMGKQLGRGFTIIELIVVIVVIGILATIVTVAYNGIQNSARDNAVLSDLEALDGIQTHYGLTNGVAGKAWYSGTGEDPDLDFTPSDGNVVDVVINSDDYCIRIYNPASASYKTLETAATKESSNGACGSLSPSDTAMSGAYTYEAIAWTQRTSAGIHDWTSVAMSADGSKIVAADYSTDTGHLFTSSDSGATWTERPGAGSNNWYDVASSSDGSRLYAVDPTGSQNLLISTDSGATWTDETSNNIGVVAVTPDGMKLIGARDTGYIYTSTDGGATLVQRTSAGSKRWNAVATSNDGTKLVATAGYPEYIYTSTDSGATWTQQTGAGMRSWGSVTSSSDGSKLAAGVWFGGYIYTSTDSGATWTAQTGSGYYEWQGLSASSDGTKLAACGGYEDEDDNYISRLFTSTDSGVTWVEQTGLAISGCDDTAMSASGARLVVLDQGGYIYTGQYN